MSSPFRDRSHSHNSTPYEPINNLENLSNKPISQFDTTSTHLRPKTIDLQRRRFRRAVVDLWLLEWFAWFLALAAIAAIVGVLVAFKGKPIPDWPYGISLSALVSVLATIATISLGGPIAAGLGQARWMWFSKERCMEDFEVIDEASKGPIGAGLMVLCGKGGSVSHSKTSYIRANHLQAVCYLWSPAPHYHPRCWTICATSHSLRNTRRWYFCCSCPNS